MPSSAPRSAPPSNRSAAQILLRLCCEDGRAVLIVSHDDRLRDIASRVVRVEDGVVGDGEDGPASPGSSAAGGELAGCAIGYP